MKRKALLKHLEKHGCRLYREGAKHTLYWNPANNKVTTIPRHSELFDFLAVKICKDLDVPPPK
ncbi:MAG: type II toxin-antitoxin system HicA family toxin [Calditrichaceae bacterium]|nr:type II toxin-antitoxin system HicA family toxin [Calditrichia bacterium]NUQ41661.1 type II toxin-antitoxin system HicA family toxin [Calditrichaceae bacterium]